MDIILKPFSWLLTFFYQFAGYGVALILFGFVVKLILFPVTLKQKKSMIQMNMLSGRVQKLQAQYGKTNPQRYQEEVQKLYAQEKVNPMGGCAWSLVPMVVLIALYGIIRNPIQRMMGVPADMIDTVAKITGVENTGAYPQIAMARALGDPNVLASAKQALGEAGDGLFAMNFSFLGLDLDAIPTWRFWEGGIHWATLGLFLLVLVSTLVSFLSMKVSMQTNKINNQTQNAQMDQTNKTMMLMMPLMSLWIGFTVPAALSVYWISQYLMTMVQEVVCGKMLKKDYEAAAAAREEQERLEKEEEKRRRREAAERKAQALADAKANKGKKKLPVEKKKSDASVISVSGVGVRAYARGRAYDPSRYRPEDPTAYRDPGEPVDEAAVEEALEKKRRFFGKKKQEEPEASKKLAEEALECQADEAVVEELLEERAAEQPEQTPAVPEESTLDVDDPWKALDQEVKDITADPEQDGETKQ